MNLLRGLSPSNLLDYINNLLVLGCINAIDFCAHSYIYTEQIIVNTVQ